MAPQPTTIAATAAAAQGRYERGAGTSSSTGSRSTTARIVIRPGTLADPAGPAAVTLVGAAAAVAEDRGGAIGARSISAVPVLEPEAARASSTPASETALAP